MDVRGHRILAGAILIGSSLGLVAVGRTLARDSPAMTAVRRQLDGRWEATRVEAGPNAAVAGPGRATVEAEFAGASVRFRGLVDGGDADGTYVIEPGTRPGAIDFKVSAGWVRGIYRVADDRLTLCVNALRPLEQLGVPSRAYPTEFRAGPGRILYEFRKQMP